MRFFRVLVATAVAALFAGLPALASTPDRQNAGRHFVSEGGTWYQVDASGGRFEVQRDVITVKFRESAARSAVQSLHEELGGREIRRARTGFVDVRVPAGIDALDFVARYAASPMVEIAEPTTLGTYGFVPNDPSYGSEWHLPQISAPTAWDTTTGDPSVVVAVLDSGTEFTHDDLGPGSDGYENVWLNGGEDAWSDPELPSTGNGVDDDGNGFIDDWKGWNFGDGDNDPSGSFFHGTAVAGVIAAKTHNSLGIAGVAGGLGGSGASAMLLGVGNSAPDAAILDDAILYAAANGARVIQLSLSVGQSAAIDAALAMAYDVDGVTIVCSSGNSGNSAVAYPSVDPHVISVGSTTMSDARSSFSQFGDDLEISAPGSGILLLDLNNGYTTQSGTSFASPIVSGVIALMLSVSPDLTNEQIRQILQDTADKVGGYDYDWSPGMPGHSRELGYGRINAASALEALGIFEDGFESGDTTAWSSTIN